MYFLFFLYEAIRVIGNKVVMIVMMIVIVICRCVNLRHITDTAPVYRYVTIVTLEIVRNTLKSSNHQ